MDRVGTCQNCGVSINATGKRGRLPSRCADCALKKKVAYNKKRYHEHPETRYVKPPRPAGVRYREIMCSECAKAFEVQVRPGGLPKACDQCKHERRLRVAREIVQPASVRLARRLRRYGLTPEQWQRMMEEQHGRCYLCGSQPKEPEGRMSLLEVDHDHTTGRVRKLLCLTCNTALGKFQDSPELLRKAADYVEGYRTVNSG